MKIFHIIVLMLIAISDVAAHETLAVAHSHVMPNALHHAGALSKLVIVAITAFCFCAIASFYRRLLLRAD